MHTSASSLSNEGDGESLSQPSITIASSKDLVAREGLPCRLIVTTEQVEPLKSVAVESRYLACTLTGHCAVIHSRRVGDKASQHGVELVVEVVLQPYSVAKFMSHGALK